MLTEKGDSYEKIVRYLAIQRYAWDKNEGNDREKLLQISHNVIKKLNPTLPEGEIPEGTRIILPTYAEAEREFSLN